MILMATPGQPRGTKPDHYYRTRFHDSGSFNQVGDSRSLIYTRKMMSQVLFKGGKPFCPSPWVFGPV